VPDRQEDIAKASYQKGKMWNEIFHNNSYLILENIMQAKIMESDTFKKTRCRAI
jgi:hypothetical protein